MHMLCACLHKTHIHTYIRMHSVSGDTRLSKLLTKNQGFASCIKYRHFQGPHPSLCMAGILQASDRITLKCRALCLIFVPQRYNPQSKICFTALTRSEISTNLGHKAGGAFSGQKALTIECSLMSGWGQGHETLDAKLEEHSLVRGLSGCGQGHEVLLQSHETKSGMESLGLSYISCFL